MKNPDSKSQKLTQRAYLNAVSSILDFSARVLVSLIITPILVSGLGASVFGIWQIIGRLAGYVSSADGRPTLALKWVIANSQASADDTIKRRAIGSALGVWLFALPVLLCIGMVMAWVSPYFVKTSPDHAGTVRIACFLLVVDMILAGLTLIPASVLRGMNLGYKRMGLVAGLNVLGGLLTATAVYLGWGLEGIAGAQVVQTIITGALFWYLVKMFLPWFGVAWASLREVVDFFKLSIWYAGWSLVNKLLLASDVIILGYIISSAQVTDYVLTGYVAQTLVAVMAVVVGAALPGLGALFGRRDFARIIELKREIFIISCFFMMVSGSMILLWNHSFVELWVGDEHYAGNWVNFLLVATVVQLLFIRNETYLIDLTLNVRRKVLLGLLSAVLSICCAIMFTQLWGVTGLCLGILLGRSILSISYPMIIRSNLKAESGPQRGGMLRPLAVMGMFFITCSLMGGRIVASTWIELVSLGCLSLVMLIGSAYVFGFSPEQRKRLLYRFRLVKPLSLEA